MRTPLLIALITIATAALALAQTIPLTEPGYELPYGEAAEFTFTPTGDYDSGRLG